MKKDRKRLHLDGELVRRLGTTPPRGLEERELPDVIGGGSLKCSFGAVPGCV